MPRPTLPSPRSAWVRITAIPMALTMIICGLLIFAFQQAVTHPTAQAAPLHKPPVVTKTSRAAVGRVIRGQWFGTWQAIGGTGFCIDFDRAAPDSRGAVRLNGNVPNRGPGGSAEVKFVANKYGLTRNADDAAAAAIFVWKSQNTKRFNDYYSSLLKKSAVSSHIRMRLAQITAEAKLHGPYRLRVTQGAGLVGQKFNGTATLTTMWGAAVPGTAILLKVNANGRLVKSSYRTDSRGRVSFTAQVTRTGSVRTDASVVVPSSAGALLTQPTAGHQRLIAASKLTQAARAFVLSQRAVGSPTVMSACTGNCHGAAPVTVAMKNAAGTLTLREFVYANSKLVGSFDVRAGKSITKSYTFPDAAKITTKSCYVRRNVCTGAQVANRGSVTVVCPDWIQYTYSGTCPCNPGKNLSYLVWAPAVTTRSYVVTLSEVRASGVAVAPQTITLAKGQRHAFAPLRFAKGDQVRLSFTVLGKTHVLDDMTQGV